MTDETSVLHLGKGSALVPREACRLRNRIRF